MKLRYGLIFFVAALILTAPFCRVRAEEPDKYALREVDLSGLTQEQKAKVFSILKKHDCTCGCNKGDLVTCRNATDEECSVSKKYAGFVRDRVKAGDKEENISAAVADGLKSMAKRIKRRKDKYSRVYDIDTAGAHYLGRPDAPVTLIAFLDFECPYCTTGYKIYKQMVKEYPDDVRFVFMHNPLNMHKGAVDFAAAVEAAAEQGKFFELADILMAKKSKYSEERVIGHAKALGLDIDKFKRDMLDVDVLTRVFLGKEEAARHGITGTPTVIINKRMARNKRDPAYFKGLIEKALGR